MAQDSKGSEQVIINGNGAVPKPKGMISAISEIQQFFVIEKTGQDIPAEFLTLDGSLDFMKIGLKSGLNESLFLFILFPVMEFYMIPFVLQSPSATVKFLFAALPFLTVFLSTFICSYISKYYVGTITRRAINSLFMGRSTSLGVKAFIIYMLYAVIDGVSKPEYVWSLAEKFGSKSEDFYYGFFEIKPHLMPAATKASLSLMVAATVPFFSVYFLDKYRTYKINRNMKFVRGK
jgi:hypothetical protein